MFLKNYWYIAVHADEVGRTLLKRRVLNEDESGRAAAE